MRVKICGITREEDAALALALGADAIGVVFYPNSARSVTVEQAQAIRGALSGLGMMVGCSWTRVWRRSRPCLRPCL